MSGQLYKKRSIGSSLLGIRELLNSNILYCRGLKSSKKGLRGLQEYLKSIKNRH